MNSKVRGRPGRGRAHPRRAGAAVLAATALVTGLLGSTTGVAQATSLPSNIAKYANCPVKNTNVISCIYIRSSSVQLKLGKFSLATTKPLTLQFGLAFNPSTFALTVKAPTNGTSLLTAPAIDLPGGLLNIPGTGVGPLAVSATPSLTATPIINIDNLRSRQGVALKLSLRAKVSNQIVDALSALGSGCYVGSASDPITLQLTTGTTKPPPPNKPISGSLTPATQVGQPVGGIKFPGAVAVDNAFRAPGAHGCGMGMGLLDAVVNADGGLPSAAGTNSATMTADIYEVDANTVRTALGMPPVS